MSFRPRLVGRLAYVQGAGVEGEVDVLLQRSVQGSIVAEEEGAVDCYLQGDAVRPGRSPELDGKAGVGRGGVGD